MPPCMMGHDLGSGRAGIEEGGPPSTLTPGAHEQQGLCGKLCASHQGTGNREARCVPGQHQTAGHALETVGEGTDVHGVSDRAGRAAGTEDGDAEEGWSDFMG